MTVKIGYTEITCNKCGSSFYTEGSFSNQVYSNKEEKVPLNWVHNFTIDDPGYGSFLDSCGYIDFHLCDNCLMELIKDFAVKPKIKDSRGNDLNL